MWTHVSSEQLQRLRRRCADGPADGDGGPGAEWPALLEVAAAGAAGPGGSALTPGQAGALAELCGGALLQGEAWGFSDEKLGVLLGLVKETHARAARGRLPMEAAFRFFRDALLRHSVQR